MSKESNLIHFDKDIAKSIGLKEAIVFQEIKNHQSLSLSNLIKQIIFIDEKELIIILEKLLKIKLIKEDLEKNTYSVLKTITSQEDRKKNIPQKFIPSKSVIKEAKSLGLSESFIESKIPEFKTYWLDRQDRSFSWDYKFLKYIVKEWRAEEQKLHKESKMSPISQSWKPSKEALKILELAEIDKKFIKDALPEFVLYWSERNISSDSWNSKFLNHVKNQWIRYQNLISHVRKPTRMTANWDPSDDCYDVLNLAKINKNFAKSQIPEFKIYWLETKEMRNCWNSKFIQHVKFKWNTKNGSSKNVLSRLKDYEWAVNFKN